jgi:hypothetical protein
MTNISFEQMFEEVQMYTDENLYEITVGEFIEMWILLQQTKED